MSNRLNSKSCPLLNCIPSSPIQNWKKGSQLIDTTLEAIARLLHAGAPLILSWSATDTPLCISTIVGYFVTLTLAFLLHNRVNVIQESFNKCTSGIPRIFQHKIDHKPEPENSTNLLEITPIPPCRTPDN